VRAFKISLVPIVNYANVFWAILFRIAGKYEYDYVDKVVAVMRSHTYNVGNSLKAAHCEQHVKWWEEYFSDASTPEGVIKFKGKVIGKIRRMHGLSLITELNEYVRSRKYLALAIKENPFYIFDYKVISGIILTYMPRRVSDFLVRKKSKGKMSFSDK
jgi:hypothetical protein